MVQGAWAGMYGVAGGDGLLSVLPLVACLGLSEKHLLCFAVVFRHDVSRIAGRAEARSCGAIGRNVAHIVGWFGAL